MVVIDLDDVRWPGAVTARGAVLVLLLCVAAACTSGGVTRVPLATLAADQEAYDGRTVSTEGVVTEVRDAPTDEPYYVLEDGQQHRVRLVPDGVARTYAAELVTVTGEFRFVADRGRELHVENIRRT